MRKAGGYAQVFGPSDRLDFVDHNGVTIKGGEADTFSCGHCGCIVHVPAFADPRSIGGGCRVCDKHICPRCVDAGNCKPLEKMLEEMESKAQFARDFERAKG